MADGYLSGATISLVLSGGQSVAATTQTNASGAYAFNTGVSAAQLQNAMLIVSGGTDTSTNTAFTNNMLALVDNTSQTVIPISPLSTLVSAMVSSGASTSSAQAEAQLAQVLGLPSSAAWTQDPLGLIAQQPALLQKMVAIQQALDMLASADQSASVSSSAAMSEAASALGAEIVRQAAQSNPAGGLSSIASLVTSAIADQAKTFSNLAAVQATAPLAAQVANLTEATIAACINQLLQSNPNAASLSGNALIAAQATLNAALTAIAPLQSAALAVARANAGATPSALAAAIANPTSLTTVAVNLGATSALQTLVQAVQSLASVPTASASPGTTLNTILADVLAILGQSSSSTPTSTTVSVTGAGTTTAAAGTAYSFAAGTYQYTLNNYVPGATIVLPAPFSSNVSVINVSATDGIIEIQADDGSANVITIVLTGVPLGTDAQVTSVATFNAVFGAGSLN